MAVSWRMLSSFLLLVTVCTHCTDDESDGDGSGGRDSGGGRTSGGTGGRGSGGRTEEGGSGGEAQGFAGNLPVGGAGVAGEAGASPGGSGNTGGAGPGGAGNGGSGGVEEVPPECVPSGEAGSSVWTCCWECPNGEPCRHLECGNGSVDRGCLVPFACYQNPRGAIGGPYYYEECDDGNQDDGDGCSSDCDIEELEPSVNCGNGRIDDDESCDDGNQEPDDGCDERCRRHRGFYCDVPGEPCVEDECGDGRNDFESQCDDGNTDSGDGCSAICDVELGWTCPPLGACEEAYCGNRSVDSYSNDDEDGFAGAWNVGGQLIRREDCDDGNQISGDGCSSHCRVEADWQCTDNGVCHRPDCGDGYILWPEKCDDGNVEPGDGCDDACQVEPGWLCARLPADGDGGAGGGGTTGEQPPISDTASVCTPSACGDGIVYGDGGEECDDGNRRAGDGCSDECEVEGEACTGFTG